MAEARTASATAIGPVRLEFPEAAGPSSQGLFPEWVVCTLTGRLKVSTSLVPMGAVG